MDILKKAEYKHHEVLGGYKFKDVVDEYDCYTLDNLNISTKREKNRLFSMLDKLNIPYTPFYNLNTLVSINFNCTKEKFENMIKEL